MIIKEFRCYEVKIEESEKGQRHRESNPGGTECLSRTPGSHSVCAVRTP